jgi:hypothetical protein
MLLSGFMLSGFMLLWPVAAVPPVQLWYKALGRRWHVFHATMAEGSEACLPLLGLLKIAVFALHL